MDKIMNYVVFLGFIYLIYISYKRNRSIFAPSNFFISFWFTNYIILMFFVRDFYLHFGGSALILLASTIVYLGSNIGDNINYINMPIFKFTNKKYKLVNYHLFRYNLNEVISKLKPLCIIFSLLGLLIIPLMIIEINGEFNKIVNPNYIRAIGRVVSYLRYKDIYQFPLYIQLLTGLNYFASLINGVYFGYLYVNKKLKYFYIYLIPIITSVLIGIITTEKAKIIYAGLLFITSFLVSYNSISKTQFKISLKKCLLFSTMFLFMICFFVYIQMNRYGVSGISGINYVINAFKVYAFGHISAFSIWFTKYLRSFEKVGYGRYTFAGVFSLLKIFNRDPGIFNDFSVVSPKPSLTNVYTAYRGLITDFTIIGALIILFVFSMFAGIAYKKTNYSIIAFIYLILYYSITVFSLFTSLLNYNTMILAFGLLGLSLFYLKYLKYLNIN